MKKRSLILSLCIIICTAGAPFGTVLSADGHAQPDDPENATYIFEDDFENPSPVGTVKSGGKPFWSSVVSDANIRVVEQENNKVAQYYNETANPGYPRLEKWFDVGTEFSDLTISLSAKNTGADNYLNLEIHVFHSDYQMERLVSIPLTNYHTVLDTWADFKIKIDPAANRYDLYVNGRLAAEKVTYKMAGDVRMYAMRIGSRVQPGTSIYLDNVRLYSMSKLVYDRMLYGGTEVNYALIQPKDASSNRFVSNLKQHPRVLVTDWDRMREKINTDPMSRFWYQQLKTRADGYLSSDLVEYAYTNGRNILAPARNIMQRLYCLAFVFNIENGDRRYLERAMAEIRNAGQFPDWTNSAAIIATELMSGLAIAYDWMYYDLTAEEKDEIFQIISDKELYQIIYAYEGVSTADINRGTSNRTTVNNAAVLMTAIALGDEHPALSQYLYEKAIQYIKLSLSEYTAEGGFPEGSMYWVYSTTYAVLAMASLDSAIEPGYQLEAEARLFDLPGIPPTGDYNIYLNGMSGRFNFGDAMEGANSYTPILYWFAQKYGVPAYATYLNYLTLRENSYAENYNLIFSLLWYNAAIVGDDLDYPLDNAFTDPTASLLTLRSSWTDNQGLYAGMQGGDNRTSHMFLSLGTFVIDAFGKRFIQTLGQSNYSWKFPMEMYYHKRGEGQNTIIANPGKGPDQNKNAAAKIERFESKDGEGFGIIDMTQTNDAFVSARRGMKITHGRKRIVLQDEIILGRPSALWWFAHTKGDIKISPDKQSAIISLDGDRMLVKITDCSEAAGFQIMSAEPLETSPKAPDEAYQDLYKLAVQAAAEKEFRLTVEFIPLNNGEAVAQTFLPVTPLEAWETNDAASVFNNEIGNRVVFMKDSPIAFVGGKRMYIDADGTSGAPFEKDGEIMLPLRFVSEKLKGSTSWIASDGVANTTINGIAAVIHSDAKTLVIDGEKRALRVPATIKDGRMFLSARDISMLFYEQVFFHNDLIILSHKKADYDEKMLLKLTRLLGMDISINGKPFAQIQADVNVYSVLAGENGQNTVTYNGLPVPLSGNTAELRVDGQTYTFHFVEDAFKDVRGTGSPDVAQTLELTKASVIPKKQTWIPIADVAMSAEDARYPKSGTIDNIISNELKNRWSAPGIAWISYDFGEMKTLHSFGLAALNGDTRMFKIKLEASLDGHNWKEIMDTTTSGATKLFDIFKLKDISARYFRITGSGDTSGGTYNSYTEVRFYESQAQEDEDKALWDIYFGGGELEGGPGGTLKLQCIGKNADGNVVAHLPVTFASSDTNVAEVDENGMVYLKNKGEATITASVNNGFRVIKKLVAVACK